VASEAPPLGERFAAFNEKPETDGYDDFGIRGDGALIFFDQWGCFLIVETGPGPSPENGDPVDNVLMLALPGHETRNELVSAIIPPISVSWVVDHFEWMRDQS
jgi:hypothetical protein